MKLKNIVIIISEKLKLNEEVIVNAIFKGKEIKKLKEIEEIQNFNSLDETDCVVLATSNSLLVNASFRKFDSDMKDFKILRPFLCENKNLSAQVQERIISTNIYLSQQLSLRHLSKHLIQNSLNRSSKRIENYFSLGKLKEEYFQSLILFSYILNFKCSKSFNNYIDSFDEKIKNNQIIYEQHKLLIIFASENKTLHTNISSVIYDNIFSKKNSSNSRLLWVVNLITNNLGSKSFSINKLVHSYVVLFSIYDLELDYLENLEKLLNSASNLNRKLNTFLIITLSVLFDNKKLFSHFIQTPCKPKTKIERNYEILFKKTQHLIDFANSKKLNNYLFKSQVFTVLIKSYNPNINIKTSKQLPILTHYYQSENFQDQELASLFLELS